MQKIYFHKTIFLDKSLKELISISVDDSISYKLEINGMRAIGSIVIYGEYNDKNQKNQFKETIDLDILANSKKIIDKKEFHVKVEDFDYSIQNGQLILTIQACVYGVKDDEDKHVYVDKKQVQQDAFEHIESLLREEEKIEELPEMEMIDSMNITQEAHDDLGTYYFCVVQNGDSYYTLSLKYNVDEKIIRNYNDNKEIKEGQIIIIPFVS